jgi:predicted CoA-substrate-specific enzyme activase
MITAGCDIGSLTAKAVILQDGKMLASEVILASAQPEKSSIEVMRRAADKAGIKMEDIEYCVGTGYGRKHIPFMNSLESEIACHGRGAVWQVPSARTVVDIGGQDAKAIKVDEKGNVERYVYNDKCASGTGRFLEIIADSLDIKLDDMGALSEKSSEKLTLSNQCVVFAETEIISLVNEGKEIADIISALHQAVANRAASLARGILVEPDAVMTGGVAKNSGMFSALERALGVKLHRVDNPQINGALGAALFAADKISGSRQ